MACLKRWIMLFILHYFQNAVQLLCVKGKEMLPFTLNTCSHESRRHRCKGVTVLKSVGDRRKNSLQIKAGHEKCSYWFIKRAKQTPTELTVSTTQSSITSTPETFQWNKVYRKHQSMSVSPAVTGLCPGADTWQHFQQMMVLKKLMGKKKNQLLQKVVLTCSQDPQCHWHLFIYLTGGQQTERARKLSAWQ